jgi:hypothetical protein
MFNRREPWFILFGAIAVALLMGLRAPSAAQQQRSFDKLTDGDRKTLGERFQREIWPLLVREGKEGCVGCHNGKPVSALKFSGDAAKDFRMLLRDGFLLKDDPGSLLERIEDPSKTRRMPPGDRPRWNDADKKILADFVTAVDQKQKP